ncbi:putative glycosyltransferase 8 domain-containing protein 1-like [Apostichopus japonicus]|uniref:Putative glycosyltransferase 8 domain-containing protein 1-like n=1 Tax=Stichopus japonicus TaxID=307972 RepID=A0A2G8KN56_STIJA|nr:putative glycosyltransferase 8 domain-containing protein 1-like [Apostichopus japonicus]
MARFYPTTVLAVLVVLVVLISIFTIPKLKSNPEKLTNKDVQERDVKVNQLIIKDEKEEVKEAEPVKEEEGKKEDVKDDEEVRYRGDKEEVVNNNVEEKEDADEDGSSSSTDGDDKETTKWIEMTQLKDIDYVLKAFNDSLVENKIVVRDARKDLASPLNFARYYFPVVFPSIEDRLIFIDADSIVQGDIQELWEIPIKQGHAAAFSDDCSSISHRSSVIQTKYMDFLNFKNPTIKALNMSAMACSFNTGVFVVDVTEWKKQRVTRQLDKWLALNTNEELYGTERGGGNSGPPFYIVFYNKYTKMSPAWNVRYLGISPDTRYSDPFVKSAKLLHWNGPYKPWSRTAQHTDDWDKYYISDPTGNFKVVRKYQTI